MPPASTQRARTAEAKAARRGSLIAAARTLLADHAYEQISLTAVAKQAGLSKASAYTYFPTKESLFLCLLKESLCAWRDAFKTALPARTKSPRTVARAIATTIAADPVLRDLLGRLHTTLETNVPDEEILAFKWFLANLLMECSAPVERACPDLKPGQSQHIFLLMHSLVIGLGMACSSVPNVERALASEPALEKAFELNFTEELAAVIELVLRGWISENTAV